YAYAKKDEPKSEEDAYWEDFVQKYFGEMLSKEYANKYGYNGSHKKIKDYYLDGLVSNEKASNSVNLGIEGTYKGLENNVLSYT
ncbi:hypothetical protein VWN47_10625, partial [Campylobacter jejuni]